MFKKEDNIKYFVGGAAIGIAAGYCISKLLHPTMCTVEGKSFESNRSADRKENKYSQDDNVYTSLYYHKNTNSCHARSKSASRYDDNVSKKISSAPSTLKTLINKDNAHNSMLECNLHIDTSKTLQNKKMPLCDISMEKNIFYDSNETKANIFSKDCIKNSEKKICNTSYLSKFDNMDTADEQLRSSMNQFNLINNINDETETQYSSKRINNEFEGISKENQLKCVEDLNCTEQPRGINTLCNNLYTNANIISNYQNVQNSVESPCVLKTYLKDDTNLATCNTTSIFEDIEDDQILHSTSYQEFQKVNLVSSTKHVDFYDV